MLLSFFTVLPWQKSFYIKASEAAKLLGKEVEPEARLPSMLIGSIILPIGLYIFAWTSYKHVHWIAPMFGGGLFGFAMSEWSRFIMGVGSCIDIALNLFSLHLRRRQFIHRRQLLAVRCQRPGCQNAVLSFMRCSNRESDPWWCAVYGPTLTQTSNSPCSSTGCIIRDSVQTGPLAS